MKKTIAAISLVLGLTAGSNTYASLSIKEVEIDKNKLSKEIVELVKKRFEKGLYLAFRDIKTGYSGEGYSETNFKNFSQEMASDNSISIKIADAISDDSVVQLVKGQQRNYVMGSDLHERCYLTVATYSGSNLYINLEANQGYYRENLDELEDLGRVRKDLYKCFLGISEEFRTKKTSIKFLSISSNDSKISKKIKDYRGNRIDNAITIKD